MGARAIAESPHLANLRELVVEEEAAGEEGKGRLRQRFGERVTFY